MSEEPFVTDTAPKCKVDMTQDAIYLSNDIVIVAYNTLLGTVSIISEE